MSCSVYSVSISGYFMVCLNCGLFTVMAAIGVLRCYSCSGVVIYILLSKNVLYWKKRWRRWGMLLVTCGIPAYLGCHGVNAVYVSFPLLLIVDEHCWQFWAVVYVVSSTPDSENGIITVDDTGEPPVVTPPTAPLHPNLMWPTLNSETEARRICEAPIIQSPAFAVCSNFTEESLDVIVESCMLDFLVYILYITMCRLRLIGFHFEDSFAWSGAPQKETLCDN